MSVRCVLLGDVARPGLKVLKDVRLTAWVSPLLFDDVGPSRLFLDNVRPVGRLFLMSGQLAGRLFLMSGHWPSVLDVRPVGRLFLMSGQLAVHS